MSFQPDQSTSRNTLVATMLSPSTTEYSTNAPVVERHPNLWLADGSVVLQAEHTVFLVHKSQLARHSHFFRDMFSLPQPSASRSHDEVLTYEGHPLIVLQDTAEDVANLLFALYDGPTFGNNDPADFQVVAGILRLSSKYLIETLRARALAHLSIAWPSTLKGWDAREEAVRAFQYDNTPSSLGYREHPYPSPIAVINLAREANAPELLASAFYDLSRYTFAQIFEPSPLDDHAASSRFRYITPPPSPPADGHFAEHLYQPSSAPAQPTLSASDLQKLAIGKEVSASCVSALIQALGRGPYGHSRRTSAYRPLSPPSAVLAHGNSPSPPPHNSSAGWGSCTTPAACRKDFAELMSLATQHYICDRQTGVMDPLYVAEEIGGLKSTEMMGEYLGMIKGEGAWGGECRSCARSLEVWAARERERMWKMIPYWFRLDPC